MSYGSAVDETKAGMQERPSDRLQTESFVPLGWRTWEPTSKQPPDSWAR